MKTRPLCTFSIVACDLSMPHPAALDFPRARFSG